MKTHPAPSFGYEKFINDVDALQSLAEICVRLGATPEDMALDALAEVAPGGHFFAAAHTKERYDGAFYAPLVADLSNHGQWSEGGALRSDQRATAIWQKVLADFAPPPHGAEADARLARFIADQSAAGGAAPMD